MKLTILDDDKVYSKRFVSAFNEFYSQVELFVFSDFERASSALSEKTTEVLLISEKLYADYQNDISGLKCKLIVILTGNRNVSEISGHKAICKYQKVDSIYQAIIMAYSEVDNIVLDTFGNSDTKVYTFISASGGSGCSTAAVAYAEYLSSKKKKTLYLDMSIFGNSKQFFSSEGNYTMTDCFMTVMNQGKNFKVKLNNFVRLDESGVNYYESCENPVDWNDMTYENKKLFIDSVRGGDYQAIIVDIPPEWNKMAEYLLEISNKVYFVTDGGNSSAAKTQKLIEAAKVSIKEGNIDSSVCEIIYNFTRKCGQKYEFSVSEAFTLPYIEGADNGGSLAKILSARNNWE